MSKKHEYRPEDDWKNKDEELFKKDMRVIGIASVVIMALLILYMIIRLFI